MGHQRETPDAEEMRKRIDELDEGIEEVRRQARDAGILVDPDEPRFYESGEESDHDDQTAAPPG